MNDKRLLAKVIIWRLLSVSTTLVLTWAFTGDVKEATGLTAVLHCVLVIGHLLFETAWRRLSLGMEDE